MQDTPDIANTDCGIYIETLILAHVSPKYIDNYSRRALMYSLILIQLCVL